MHLVDQGNKPATSPVVVRSSASWEPAARARHRGPLMRRPVFAQPIDRCDARQIGTRIAAAAAIPDPARIRHAAITNALAAEVACATDPHPRPTETSW